jgi:pyruvate kinase
MRELVAMIRQVEEANSRPIGILADLQGPKLRLGTIRDGAIAVKHGDTVVFD